jgi:hypothetical protein
LVDAQRDFSHFKVARRQHIVQARNWGTDMRTTTIHTAQISSPFGNGYVMESHGDNQLGESRRMGAKGLAVAAILFFGATAAGAITVKAKVGHSVDQIRWQSLSNMPRLVGIEEPVY